MVDDVFPAATESEQLNFEKLMKSWAYALITMCSVTGFGMWTRECTSKVIDCKNIGKVAVASFSAVSGVASFLMLSFWITAGKRAINACYWMSHLLFILLVTASALAFEVESDTTMIWLWVGALPALLLIVYNWLKLWPFCTRTTEQSETNQNGVLDIAVSVHPLTSNCCATTNGCGAGTSTSDGTALSRTDEFKQRW